MSFKIAVDIDDVVLDYANAFLKFFNEETGLAYKKADITNWYGESSLRVPPGFGRSVPHMFADFPHTEGFYGMRMIPGAQEGLQQLLSEYDVSFITARSSPEAQQHIYDTFHARQLPMDKIYFAQNKGRLASQLKIDVLVDDAQHNLNRVYGESPKTWPVVYTQPWNKSWGGRRVNDWPELVERMPELWNEKNGIIVRPWRSR